MKECWIISKTRLLIEMVHSVQYQLCCYDDVDPVLSLALRTMFLLPFLQYPKTIGGVEVTSVRDLSGQGYDSNQPNKKPVLIFIPFDQRFCLGYS